jgi:hypothetical protein
MRRLTRPPAVTPERERDEGADFPTIQKSFDKTYSIFGAKNRRDSIIAVVQREHAGEVFAEPFITHVQKMGKKKLDDFSDLEFLLLEYNIRLVFVTSKMDRYEMTYRVPKLSDEPDPNLCEKRWFGIF